jgi:hypothetical protein
MQITLSDKRRNADRISGSKLEPYFSDEVFTMMGDDDVDMVLVDDANEKKNKKKAKKSPHTTVTNNWFSDALREVYQTRKQKPQELESNLISAARAVAKKNGTAEQEQLKNTLGGQLMLRTMWAWRQIDSHSISRDIVPIARVAIQEHLVIDRFRKNLILTHPSVRKLRQSLGKTIENFLKTSRTVVEKRGVETAAIFKFADGISHDISNDEDADAEGDGDGDGDDNPQPKLSLTKRMLMQQDLRVGQDAIRRLVDTVESHAVSSADGVVDHIALEVHQATDHLIKVIINICRSSICLAKRTKYLFFILSYSYTGSHIQPSSQSQAQMVWQKRRCRR